MFIKNKLTQKNVKRSRNSVSKSISFFLDIAKFTDLRWKKSDVHRTQRVCHVIHVLFGSSLGKLQLCQVWSLQYIVWQILVRGPYPPSPYPLAAPKKPTMNRVNTVGHFYGVERGTSNFSDKLK